MPPVKPQRDRRITDLEYRGGTLPGQAKRDQQLLLHLQQRLVELEKRIARLELEPPVEAAEE